MNKQTAPPTLESKIVAALDGASVGSATVMEVIADVEAQIAATDQTIIEERKAALDLTKCPDAKAALDHIAELELFRDQLKVALPKLRDDKLPAALESERHSRWLADYKRVKSEQVALARDFAETYKRVSTELCYVLTRTAALDIKCAEVDSQASNLQNEHRRLGKTELLSRGITSFSRSQPELAKSLILPDFVESARTRWPATSPTSFAASFSQSAIFPGHPGANWATPSPEEQARRSAAIAASAAMNAAFHEQAAMDEENRINKTEKERFAAEHKRAP
jgi:hypothetical protein